MQQKTGQWFLVTGVLVAMIFLNHGILSEYIPFYGVTLLSAVIVFAVFLYTKSIYAAQKTDDQNVLLEGKKEVLTSINNNMEALTKRIDLLNDEMSSKFTDLEQGLENKFALQEDLIITQFSTISDLVSKSTDTLQALLNEKTDVVLKSQEEKTTAVTNKITESNRTMFNKLEEIQTANRELMHKRSDLVIETVRAFKADVERYNEALNTVIDTNNVAMLDTLQADKLELIDNLSVMQEALIISSTENKVETALSKEAIIANEIEIMNRLIAEILAVKDAHIQELNVLREENNIINQNAENNRNISFVKVGELITDKAAALMNALNIFREETVAQTKETISAGEQNKATIIEMFSDGINSVKQELNETRIENEQTHRETLSVLEIAKVDLRSAEDKINASFVKTGEFIADKTIALANALNILKEESAIQAKEAIAAGEQNKANIIELFRDEMNNIKQELIDTKAQHVHAQQEALSVLESAKMDLLADIVAVDHNLTEALDGQMQQMDKLNAFVREDIMRAKDSILASQMDVLENNRKEVEKRFEETEQQTKVRFDVTAEKLEELHIAVNEKYEVANAKTIAMNESITAMKSDVRKQFESVLDMLDDNAETRDRKHNQLFKQTQDFSRAVDNELRKLKSDVLNGQKEITKQGVEQNEKIVHLQNAFNEKQNADGDIYNHVTIQQNAMLYTLDELQRKVAVIDDIMNAMKKISGDKAVVSTDRGFHFDPNRVEEIMDQESGMTVAHVYNNGQIVSSKMKKKGKVVYERNYEKNGSLKNTKSYDNKGQVVTELTYWPNGQVKERIEWFDKNGSKQKNITKYDDKGQVLK